VNVDEFLVLTGGPVDESALPTSIPSAQYDLFANWLTSLQGILEPLTKGAASARVALVQTRSPSLVCRVRLLDDGTAAVVVPIGAFARTRVWARMLLQWLLEDEEEPTMKIAASILDDYSESHWQIAPRLAPLFGELRDESEHWSELAALDASLSLDAELEPAVDDLVWACLVYLILHEVAHVVRDHFRLVAQPTTTSGPDDVAIRRALEIDADAAATHLLLFVLFAKVEGHGDEALESAFYWLGYAMALLLGLYDSRRKSLGLYSTAYYPHPVVRHRLLTDFARVALADQRPDLLEAWDVREAEGWAACVRALWKVDIEAFTGRFGGSKGDTPRFVPVTALNYAEFDSSFVREQVEEEKARAAAVMAAIGRS
jgi:hypothetical protein